MKFIKHNVEIDITGTEELKKYKNNGISVLPKKQKYFGMFVQKINGIIPEAFNSYEEIDEDELCFWYGYERMEYFDKPIPLIFRVVDEEYAEEIISGKLIKIGDEKENSDLIESDSFDDFQLKFDKFKNNPLVIDTDGYYPAIGNFKMIYANYHRGHEEEFREMMDRIENKAKSVFNEKTNKMIYDAEDMAYTDNIIYDYEKKLEKRL